jgi:hypothetical protein
MMDIVAEGFDAGIRFGHLVQADMIATRLTPSHDFASRAIVARDRRDDYRSGRVVRRIETGEGHARRAVRDERAAAARACFAGVESIRARGSGARSPRVLGPLMGRPDSVPDS